MTIKTMKEIREIERSKYLRQKEKDAIKRYSAYATEELPGNRWVSRNNWSDNPRNEDSYD